MPGRLVALESEIFFDFSRALSVDFSFNLCLVLMLGAVKLQPVVAMLERAAVRLQPAVLML